MIYLAEKAGDIETGNIDNGILRALKQFRLVVQYDFLAIVQNVLSAEVI